MNIHLHPTVGAALRSIDQFKILASPSEVLPFVKDVQKHADSEKRALGFFPQQVFNEAAHNGKLLVATIAKRDVRSYVGHLFYGGVFPNGRIVQLYVIPKYRKQGIARKLVSFLSEVLEHHSFLGIFARVASDLEANEAWERLGFLLVKQIHGGITTNRMINVRARELRTPTLFSGVDSFPDIDLAHINQVFVGRPTYAIDLNVFFDLIKDRKGAEDAAAIINAGLSNLIRIAVTQEFISELRRTSKSHNDPVLDFAAELPVLSPPPLQVQTNLTNELLALAFPDALHTGKIRSQDESDLIHISTAIHHTLTGFVTNEKALLRERHQVFQKYGLKLLNVNEFAQAIKTLRTPLQTLEVRVSGLALSIKEADIQDRAALRAFVSHFMLATAFAREFTTIDVIPSSSRIILISSGPDIICAAVSDRAGGLQDIVEFKVLANEESPAIETALDILFDQLSREASRSGKALLRLETPPGFGITRAVAATRGFVPLKAPSVEHGILSKISIGGPLSDQNWSETSKWLRQNTGMSLPESLPVFTGADSSIKLQSASRASTVALSKFETMMSPTIILFPGRPAVIVPIRRNFADDLLGTPAQQMIFPSGKTVLLPERAYYSSPRNQAYLQRGSLMVFYESGVQRGRCAAIAVARILDTVVAKKGDISANLLRHGVLDEAEIEYLTSDDRVAVTTFDNILIFRNFIPLKKLRAIGCVNAANLVAPTRLKFDHLVSIVREGDPRA